VDGEVMGFLVGYVLIPPTNSKRVGWIEMLGVHPESQNKGVGRLLVERFYEECRRKDAVVNCLVRLNDEKLAKFYSSLGFKPFDFIIYTKQ
jgi:ribosomal protein S18 acetylase RimI-like enzyme